MKKHFVIKVFAFSLFLFLQPLVVFAQDNSFPEGSSQGTMQMQQNTRPVQVPNIDINIREPKSGQEVAFSVRLLIILTVLTIAPTLLLLLTCFLRFSIVLDFIKRALSLQQVPPTAILNGIAFFMTLFVMWPTFNSIYNNAYKPMADGEIGIEQAYRQAEQPLRIFMAEQMDGNYDYIKLFMSIGQMDQPNDLSDVPTHVLIPAYILHELTVAFHIGIYLYIPFIIIDMVVASILMSMGMMMLPPVQISMPFKLMLFVLVDGWGLLIQSLFNSVL
ncbi:flagellar type III secretion system pore protein FliP [Treponema sp.]|uniref:flagellar type III secretion system pore protein FliP n=1 Tax=Treponema sp. TaxID=166 RepID=UPI00298D6F8D|nr:flagellar type III secretion system pore protein FliP [Treponema sp.]MCR5613424.1 flagellar type III secretion system pore protein FliP [Treponema sp.]